MQVTAAARLHLKTARSALTSRRTRRWAGLISSFLAGQGAVQLLNLLTGFLLLRWMSVESYAQFSIAFGFQSMLQWLVDLGAVGSIVALVGNRRDDKELVGKYIRSAKYLRFRLLCLTVPVAAIIFLLITSKQQWSWPLKVLLFSSVVGALGFQSWASFYSTPLLIRQNIKQFYKPQIVSSVGRLFACFLLKIGSALLAWTSAWVSTLAIAVHGLIYRLGAKDLVIEPVKSDPRANKEMIHYLAPTIPWVVFTAFQGQISLFLITWFGQTRNVAEVAALGRIGQLFLILTVANSVVVSPYVAGVPRDKLLRRYVQILSVSLGIALSLCFLVFIFPQPLLWVLGPKYENLGTEIGWAVAAACTGYVGSVMLAMHNARKWVYWWWSAAHIVTLISIQIVCLFIFDLSKTIHVIYFSLTTNLAALFILLIAGTYGFIYGPPKKLA